MSRAKQFIDQQLKANQELYQFGRITNQTADELEQLGDSLTADEVDEVCELANEKKLENDNFIW